MFVPSEIKLYSKQGIVGFYPLNSCKFVLPDTNDKFYVLVSVIKNGNGEVFEVDSNTVTKKEFNKIGVTFHVLVNTKYGNIQINDIFEYITNTYKLDLSC